MLRENGLDPRACHVAKEDECVVGCELPKNIDVFLRKRGIEPRRLEVLTTRLVGCSRERRKEIDVLCRALDEAITECKVDEPSRIWISFGINTQNMRLVTFVAVFDDDTAVIEGRVLTFALHSLRTNLSARQLRLSKRRTRKPMITIWHTSKRTLNWAACGGDPRAY